MLSAKVVLRVVSRAAGAAWLLGLVQSLSAANYHIDCESGRDANDGRDPARAWQTIARANQQTFAPGGSLLLKRGCVWQGAGFRAKGNGTAEAPITLADYGESSLARAVIDGVGTHEPAVLLLNVQNWTVRNLGRLPLNRGLARDRQATDCDGGSARDGNSRRLRRGHSTREHLRHRRLRAEACCLRRSGGSVGRASPTAGWRLAA